MPSRQSKKRLRDSDQECDDSASEASSLKKPKTGSTTIPTQRNRRCKKEVVDLVSVNLDIFERDLFPKKGATDGFPRYQKGTIYIQVFEDDPRYEYTLNKALLSKVSEVLGTKINANITEPDNGLAKKIKKREGLEAFFKLMFSETENLWVLERLPFTFEVRLPKPQPQIKTQAHLSGSLVRNKVAQKPKALIPTAPKTSNGSVRTPNITKHQNTISDTAKSPYNFDRPTEIAKQQTSTSSAVQDLGTPSKKMESVMRESRTTIGAQLPITPDRGAENFKPEVSTSTTAQVHKAPKTADELRLERAVTHETLPTFHSTDSEALTTPPLCSSTTRSSTETPAFPIINNAKEHPVPSPDCVKESSPKLPRTRAGHENDQNVENNLIDPESQVEPEALQCVDTKLLSPTDQLVEAESEKDQSVEEYEMSLGNQAALEAPQRVDANLLPLHIEVGSEELSVAMDSLETKQPQVVAEPDKMNVDVEAVESQNLSIEAEPEKMDVDVELLKSEIAPNQAEPKEMAIDVKSQELGDSQLQVESKAAHGDKVISLAPHECEQKSIPSHLSEDKGSNDSVMLATSSITLTKDGRTEINESGLASPRSSPPAFVKHAEPFDYRASLKQPQDHVVEAKADAVTHRPEPVVIVLDDDSVMPTNTAVSTIPGDARCAFGKAASVATIDKRAKKKVLRQHEIGSSDHQLAVDAHDNLFRALYDMDIQLHNSDVKHALKQIEYLVLITNLYDCRDIIKKNRHYLNSQFLQFGRDLYQAVLEDPPRWIRLSLWLGCKPVFIEAIIHMAGQFPNYPWTVIPQSDIHPPVRDLIRKKALALHTLKTAADSKLFLSNISIKGESEGLTLLTTDEDTVGIWMVVQTWRDWFCNALRKHAKSKHELGSTYRLIAKGSNAYLDTIEVYSKLVSCGSIDPGWSLQVVEADMKIMKDYAQEIVHGLAVNHSMLAIEASGIKHLTCTKVEDHELPWHKNKS